MIEKIAKTLSKFLVIFTVAIVAWSLWLVEVYWVKGWSGLNWLSGFNWSAVPICGLLVGTCVHVIASGAKGTNRAKFIAFGFVVTTGAFIAGRWAILEFLSGNLSGIFPIKESVILIAAVLSVSIGLTLFAKIWLSPIPLWTTWLLIGGLVLVLPLSFATIKVVPALNGSTDEVHSIKMGYPVFWITLLLPICFWLAKKRSSLR